MKKLVDAAIVAALLLSSIPDLSPDVLPQEPPAPIIQACADDTHGDRPC